MTAFQESSSEYEMVCKPGDGSRVDLEGSHFPVGHALNLRPDEARV